MCTCEEGYEYNNEQKTCFSRNYGVVIGASIAGGVAFVALAFTTAYLFFSKGSQRGSSGMIGIT